ncbi:MAG TPA: TolC family protein [Terriglobales bacterium]
MARSFIPRFLLLVALVVVAANAETLPLKRAVELAVQHSSTMAASHADEQRAFATYMEERNQYLPQLSVGSGLGPPTLGYPLTLEGIAPSLVNINASSAVFNLGLQEFIRAARTEYVESQVQTKDQREQVIQDTVLSYAELCKWQSVSGYASREYDAALKAEQAVNERVQQGVDSALARNQARLVTARIYLRISQAQGSIDVLRRRLAQLTGLPAESIEADADSIPKLPEVKQEENLQQTAEASLPVEIADLRAHAFELRAKGEHRAMWPTFDFAGQFAYFAKYTGYQDYFQKGSFQAENGSVGVVIKFPFFNLSQRSHAKIADADAQHARHDVETTKAKVSEQTLRLQRSVDQLGAAQQVSELEYEIAKSTLDATQVKAQSGGATWHDEEDARVQASEKFGVLQDANFELQRARIQLLRATGGIGDWAGVGGSQSLVVSH